MSTVNSNIVDYLTQIEKITSTNLQILKTLNDSFYSKKNHLYAEIDDATYVIPSFISLENKINMLQENFENLVKAPERSEAYFNFDGNTRAIEVRKYNHVPDSITLPTVKNYAVEQNDIFKDFMTPVPYVNFELPYIPNDIVEVNVKKVVPKSDALKSLFKTKLAYTVETATESGEIITETHYNRSINESYGNIYKLLLNYKEDIDYVEYDTIYKLPVRSNIGTGTYVIESVVSDYINNDLEELITLKLRKDLKNSAYSNKLTYKLFDDTIEKALQVGDELVNYDGTGKVVITDIRPATHTITVKVVNGEYLNFLGTDTYDTDNDRDIHDLSKLRFYAAIDFDADKHVKVPLEEDQYVFVAVAVLNSRMNVQSSWGTGLIIDAHALMNEDETKSFKTYYDANVKNIGDILYEMTSMITSPITALSQDAFNAITAVKPNLTEDGLSVMQINKHLNNSETVKNIRDAYNQKKIAEKDLAELQVKIDELNTQISSLTFNDASGARTMYVSQLSALNSKKTELLTVVNNAINSISLSVNASEIPIENAKYRIRGFYVPNLESVAGISLNDHVIGVQVQYRYKNLSTELGNAVSMTGKDGSTYIYSDWNVLNTFNKSKIANCVDGIYTYKYEDNNESTNEPSFNQIDIPISQGETVDIRVKMLYDFGQPYINVTSAWSNIISIGFPEEFTKDVPVLTIISENNNDIETNRFNTILSDTGVNTHIQDMIVDQNTTYYHKPDSIASGFYTDERRIIPLKDKLVAMNNEIAQLKSELYGGSGNCQVSLVLGDSETQIFSDRENTITLESYNSFVTNAGEDAVTNDGVYNFANGVVSTLVNIAIKNIGDTAMKLYSVFPGNRNIRINNTSSSYVKKGAYCSGKDEGIWFRYQYDSEVNKLQTQNQFITFRMKDLWTGTAYYKPGSGVESQNEQESRNIGSISKDNHLGMVAYPYVSTKHGLCIDSDDARSYTVINPGESIVVPIFVSYVATEPNTSIKKTLSFDLRTSLYSDPVNYAFTIIGKNTSSFQDKLTVANKKRFWDRLTDAVKYTPSVSNVLNTNNLKINK